MSEAEFYELVSKMRPIAGDHPLFAECERGFSPVAVHYMRRLVKAVSDPLAQAAKIQAERREKVVKEAKEEKNERDRERAVQAGAIASDKPVPREIDKLYREQRNLHARRAKLSNSFHVTGTIAERAKISREIQAIQRMIQANRIRLRAWHERGVVPASDRALVEGAETMSEADLIKKLDSLKGSRRRYKKLEKMALSPPVTSEDEAQASRARLKIEWKDKQIEYVESIVKASRGKV